MNKIMINEKYFSDHAVIIRTLRGPITVDEVIDSFNYILSNYLTAGHIYDVLINDLTNAELKFTISEFRGLVNFVRQSKELMKLRFAVVVSSPINQMFPSLASLFLKFEIKMFKTMNEAIDWGSNQSSIKAC